MNRICRLIILGAGYMSIFLRLGEYNNTRSEFIFHVFTDQQQGVKNHDVKKSVFRFVTDLVPNLLHEMVGCPCPFHENNLEYNSSWNSRVHFNKSWCMTSLLHMLLWSGRWILQVLVRSIMINSSVTHTAHEHMCQLLVI